MKLQRTIAMILAMTLCLGTVAQAASSKESVGEQEIESDIYSRVSFAGKTYVRSQEYDGIYEAGNQYVMAVNDEEDSTKLVVIPMERKDINFNDKATVEAFLKREDIPKEAIASFKEKYQSYLALEGSETVQPSLTMFEPAKATTARGAGDPDYISYYTYNGWSMMTYHFDYTNLSTGWKNIVKGRTTKDKAQLIYDVALAVGSEVSKKISYFSTGKSILEAFLTYYGLTSNDISKNVSDYFQARLVWDQSEKYTMTDYGGLTSWQTGLVTYKVTVRKLGQETYFAKSGKDPYTTDVTYSEVVKSEDYDNPWAKAFENGGYTEWQYVSWETGDVSFNFT